MELTLALGDYAHGRSLATGAVLARDGHSATLNRVVDEPAAIFRRAREDPPPFDVTEMSLATTYVLADQADPTFLALPVFPSRMFRHSAFYVRDPDMTADKLTAEDLRGKRIGVVRYGMTAAVWARALLAELYGIQASDLTWYIGERQFFAPQGVTLNPVLGRAALEAMLEEGELDVLFSVHEPEAFRAGRLHRFFPDFAAAERAQFTHSGVYPIMHAVLVRRSLVETHPWLTGLLFQSFLASRDEALSWLTNTDVSSLPLPFQHGWSAEVRGLLGTHAWPYGMEANHSVLTAFGRHMHEQGLTAKALRPEDVFTVP